MSRFVVVTVALAVVAGSAQANVGAPSSSGTRATEPIGLGEIAIEREQLSFDLRPLGRDGLAKVSAVYQLENRGAATVTASLVFVSGAPIHRSAVTFDRSPVPGETLSEAQVAALPPSWNGPISTPAIGGGDPLPYDTEDGDALAFTLAIPPGRHELAVRFEPLAQWDRSMGRGTLLHQLGYVLAPARDWGSFGTLEVSIEVPPGWRAATSPALSRTGDTLRGRFAGLPADTIGITVQAPTGLVHDVLQIALPVLLLVVLLGGGCALYAIGRARRRRSGDVGALWRVAFPVAAAWGLGIAVFGGLASIRAELAIADDQAAAYGYGGAFGIIAAVLGAVIAVPVGALIARAGYFVASLSTTDRRTSG